MQLNATSFPVICGRDNYYGLGCTDFVGRDDFIEARIEFVGELVHSPTKQQLEFHVTAGPRVLGKPDGYPEFLADGIEGPNRLADHREHFRIPRLLLSAYR